MTTLLPKLLLRRFRVHLLYMYVCMYVLLQGRTELFFLASTLQGSVALTPVLQAVS